MGRLGILGACTLLAALSGPVHAAEITHVASAAETNKTIDVDLSIRWDRTQKRVRITREQPDPAASPPIGAIIDQTALRYTEISNAIVPRMAIGIFNDLEIHVEWPYVLADDVGWRQGLVYGNPSTAIYNGTAPGTGVSPSGNPCTAGTAPDACPMFPYSPPPTVYHGGKMGDLTAGVTWGILSDKRDDTKPFWLVGFDLTFPTAERYDPAGGRDPNNWLSPFAVPAKRAPIGDQAWKYDFFTALSKRIGGMDPYFRAHVTIERPGANAYSNCLHAAQYAEGPVAAAQAQFASWAPANCSVWGDRAGPQLPTVTGIVFGTEIVPYEDRREGQKVTIDVRITADYTSSARWYNELTDATGKILHTDPFGTIGGRIGLYLRASEVVSLRAAASFETQTAHFLTGEKPGASDYLSNPTNPNLNPNFDARYDAPGNRFRATEVSIFTLSIAGVLQF
ncbi:MAG TPA: hypothetical protein VLU43_06310 [Anaeromyxobacteraceae bacterium]|nr:hypothetical protein [Anaeromyxobacteraceae bacterium]